MKLIICLGLIASTFAFAAGKSEIIEISKAQFDQSSNLLSWESQIQMKSDGSEVLVSPALTGFGMGAMKFTTDTYMQFGIEGLYSKQLKLSLDGDHFHMKISFDQGSVGNGVISYAIAPSEMNADFYPEQNPDGHWNWNPKNITYSGTLKSGKLGKPFLDMAQEHYTIIAQKTAEEQVTKYFANPKVQAGVEKLLLLLARMKVDEDWSHTSAVHFENGKLVFTAEN